MHYAGDLTRTFPVGKSFTSRQKNIYQVVLDAINHSFKILAPGVRFIEVHTAASIKLMEGLKTLTGVKQVKQLLIGTPARTEQRTVVDSTYDVSELMYFDSAAEQDEYQVNLAKEAAKRCDAGIGGANLCDRVLAPLRALKR